MFASPAPDEWRTFAAHFVWIMQADDPKQNNVNASHPLSNEELQPSVRPALPARVLIVEDNWLVAVEVEAALSEAGHDVVGVAMSAQEALHLGEVARPDIVLMDIRLQGDVDGVDAAIQLRTRFGIRSIFLTAHGEPETQARATAAEPLGWVLKPISSTDLLRRLAEIMAT